VCILCFFSCCLYVVLLSAQWGGPNGIEAWSLGLLFLHCFYTVGWVFWPIKPVPDMTYNVFGGTLNSAQLNCCHQHVWLLYVMNLISNWFRKLQTWYISLPFVTTGPSSDSAGPSAVTELVRSILFWPILTLWRLILSALRKCYFNSFLGTVGLWQAFRSPGKPGILLEICQPGKLLEFYIRPGTFGMISRFTLVLTL